MTEITVLNNFPAADVFYGTYWGRKPFVVRGGVDPALFDEFIDGDTLAGLSLEAEVKSRIVTTMPEEGTWTCEHGPFAEDRFTTLGEKNWSLLVQNVEQYHTETANLLHAFNFSPRWLLDDVMVSYSAAGGTVGPHIDSYHVFLVQGMGRRIWKVGETATVHEDYIEGLDLKVLKNGVDGADIEVSIGDVIYIPPHFAHEGMTLETAMTFSVGFLGPKISDLFIEYGYYLGQLDAADKRYSGQCLDADSSAFTIARPAQDTVCGALTDALHSEHFSVWMAEYFSTPTDIDAVEPREEPLAPAQILTRLQAGENLYRPEHVKLCITVTQTGTPHLAVFGATVPTTPEHTALIRWLDQQTRFSVKELGTLGDQDAVLTVLAYLYNQRALFFDGDDLTL